MLKYILAIMSIIGVIIFLLVGALSMDKPVSDNQAISSTLPETTQPFNPQPQTPQAPIETAIISPSLVQLLITPNAIIDYSSVTDESILRIETVNTFQVDSIFMAIVAGNIDFIKYAFNSIDRNILLERRLPRTNSAGLSDDFNYFHLLLLNLPPSNGNDIMELFINSGFTYMDRSKNGISIADIFEDLGEVKTADHIRKLEADMTIKQDNGATKESKLDLIEQAYSKDKAKIIKKQDDMDVVLIKSLSNRINLLSDSEKFSEYVRLLRKPSLKVLQFLIDNQFDVNYVDEHGNTPLLIAIHFQNKEFVLKLLANGSDSNLKSTSNYSPLHLASTLTNPSVLIALIVAGADINETIENGGTIYESIINNPEHPLREPLLAFTFSSD